MAISGLHTLYISALALLFWIVPVSVAAPNVIRSQSHPGVEVTYKQTHICETTPGVRAYAGYIHLPATLDPVLQPYDANIFFWFFEARISPATAPLTLWLQGGPGAGSIIQAVSGHNGPCTVKADSNSTAINPWSWNGVSNMLYIDQPSQTGYSYDDVHEGFMDMLTGDVDVSTSPLPANSWTNRRGKFASQDPGRSANTTALSAAAVTHFLEAWFQEFNRYKRSSINIWSQSYGGHFAPAIATSLTNHHKRCRRSGSHNNHGPPFSIKVNSVGLINGFIDPLKQISSFPQFATENTYDIKAYSDSVAAQATQELLKPGGCKDQTDACIQLQNQYDPDNYGNSDDANGACLAAFGYCWENVYGPYEALSGRSPFDIGHLMPDPFPHPYAVGFLNNQWVQKALGAKINYTEPQNAVGNTFVFTGDYIRAYHTDLGKLLDAGVKVALLHGDRDFRCNWFGGEAVSLEIPHSRQSAFNAAGYANIITSLTYIGGVVRQHGLLSFSRVFQSGHEIPYYQPQTALAIFARTIQGRDVATGIHPIIGLGSGYSTSGPSSVRGLKTGPPSPPQGPVECYVDHAPLSDRCTDAQIAALVDGSAVVVGRVVVSPGA